jgi:hypothetical protein
MAFDWKSPLRVLAPTVATALGGPLAGAAVAALSNKLLGKPNGTEAEIAAVVAGAKPEDLLKLKELEVEFKEHMAALGVELDKLEVDDRKDARARQVSAKDWVPSLLALVIVTALMVMMGLMFGHVIPAANHDVFLNLIGILEGAVLSVMNFEFGSSRSSREKDAVLGRVAEKNNGRDQ